LDAVPSSEVDASTALNAAAELGPYFTWQPRDADAGWRPFADLLDPSVVTERVRAGRLVLMRLSGRGRDEIDERVVASTVFLGVASRLLSPLLAAAALTGVVPLVTPDRLWWRPTETGPMPIAYDHLSATKLTAAASEPAPASPHAGDQETDPMLPTTPVGVAKQQEAAELLSRTAVSGVVGPVLQVFRERFVLSPQVMWGNVASALGGAAGMIADHAADPAAAEASAGIVAGLLIRGPLTGTAVLERPDPQRARWFLVRNNCCLYYRLPGGGTCGDCVLTPDAVRRQHWTRTLNR
jgi:hypothetical protein